MNKPKLAINSKACESEVILLEGKENYKYFCIIETSNNTISKYS